MADSHNANPSKRRFLLATTTVAGGAAAAATATPFIMSMFPSERAKAAGAPVEFDLGKVEPGMLVTVEWRGKPVWVVNRTKEMLDSLDKVAADLADPASDVSMQPDYCKNKERARKPQFLIVEGICTHLGCSPTAMLKAGVESGLGAGWQGGFYCPCHGSKFDLAGRVFKGVPAPTNLRIPAHTYLSETRLLIGEDKKGA